MNMINRFAEFFSPDVDLLIHFLNVCLDLVQLIIFLFNGEVVLLNGKADILNLRVRAVNALLQPVGPDDKKIQIKNLQLF